MKPARILLLVIAILAGGLAAFLATRGDAPTTEVAQVEKVREPVEKVLVAKESIGVGQRLTSAELQWQDWPEGALRPDYITEAKTPEAMTQLEGTVARFEIFAGEPINTAKLVRADEGYLSAVLSKGMRAVSLPVNAESAAGGFIVPNDRVDLVQTQNTPAGRRTQVLLENVRVLAIGHRLGEKGTTGTAAPGAPGEEGKPATFDAKAIATLEVTPAQAQAVINASRQGDLALALRSILDYGQPVILKGGDGTSDGVRMIRFGQETTYLPSSGGQQDVVTPATAPDAAVNPAAFAAPDAAVGQVTPVLPTGSTSLSGANGAAAPAAPAQPPVLQ